MSTAYSGRTAINASATSASPAEDQRFDRIRYIRVRDAGDLEKAQDRGRGSRGCCRADDPPLPQAAGPLAR